MPFLKMLQLILSSSAQNLILKGLSKALQSEGLPTNINGIITTLLKRPSQFAKMLSKLPQAKLTKLQDVLNQAQLLKTKMSTSLSLKTQIKKAIEENNPEQYKKLKNAFNDFNKTRSMSDFSNIAKKYNDVDIDKNIDEQIEYTTLSSSWLSSGTYNFRNFELTLSTIENPAKKYAFPSVNPNTWELMKNAEGKNGKGAGKIAWDNIAQFIAKRQKAEKKKGLTKKPLNKKTKRS